jgi:hypothetical protein
MKIAILTMVFNNNYGGMLQAYALLKYLRRLGHETTLINVKYKRQPYYKIPFSILKRFLLKFIFKRDDITNIIPE